MAPQIEGPQAVRSAFPLRKVGALVRSWGVSFVSTLSLNQRHQSFAVV
jgi:hypothetical protein